MSTYPFNNETRSYISGDVPWFESRSASRSGFLDTAIACALSAFAFVLPTDIRMPDGKSIAMRLGYICLALGIAGLIKRRSVVVPSVAFGLLVGFLVWTTLTMAWALHPDAALQKILAYWTLLATVVMIPQYAWHPRVRGILLDAYIAGCWLGVIGVVANYAAGVEFSDPSGMLGGRYSFGTDPNYLALALVIGIPFAIYRVGNRTTGWHKASLMLYVPAAIIGVGLTGSRGGVFGLGALIVISCVITARRTLLVLAGGATLCLAVMWFLPTSVAERFATIPDEIQHGSFSDRRDLWERATAIVCEHPLVGIGAGASRGKFEIAAHETPLELMMEGGVVSVLLFYGAGITGIRRAWKVDPGEGRFLTAVCAAWFAGSLSLSWEANTITWFIFALLFAAAPPISQGSKSAIASDFGPRASATDGHIV